MPELLIYYPMEQITYDKAKEIWNKIAKTADNQSLYFDLEVHKKLLDIFHIGPYYYYIFNLITASIEFMDSKMTQVLGYSEEEFCVKLFFNSIHPVIYPITLILKIP